MKRLITVALVAVLSLGVVSVSLAEEAGGQAATQEGGKAAKKSKKHSHKKHKKHAKEDAKGGQM